VFLLWGDRALAIEQAIAFYNDFLERQERYQQETPEQRQAEKAWIDQQRRELGQVQHGIEAILNAS
jgi:DNA-binding protein H-NS